MHLVMSILNKKCAHLCMLMQTKNHVPMATQKRMPSPMTRQNVVCFSNVNQQMHAWFSSSSSSSTYSSSSSTTSSSTSSSSSSASSSSYSSSFGFLIYSSSFPHPLHLLMRLQNNVCFFACYNQNKYSRFMLSCRLKQQKCMHFLMTTEEMYAFCM